MGFLLKAVLAPLKMLGPSIALIILKELLITGSDVLLKIAAKRAATTESPVDDAVVASAIRVRAAIMSELAKPAPVEAEKK